MCSSTTRALREARPVSLQYEYKKVHRIENGECTGRCYIQKFTYTRPICLNLLCNGISAGFFMPVSVASSDGVTASPGSTQSDGTVLSAPADTAAAGAPADTRASPASPGSSASSHDPIRDMDFDNVPALSCSWSDIDQELYERALNITPELDRPKTSKGRPRITHLRKVLSSSPSGARPSRRATTYKVYILYY